MDNQLPVYQHPALTVLLDDSQSFLDCVAFQLNPRLACKTFNDPARAIAWLRAAQQRSPAFSGAPIRVGYDDATDLLERRSASINLSLIRQMATDKQRFNTPAVVVVDYSMPQMNGVLFCESIRNLPCKKILLTGLADDAIAIDAFNRKLIDCFIRKSDPDAVSRLETEILRLQREFFLAQNYTLKDLLARHSFAFLNDPAMAMLVSDLLDRYRFVEYYLFPNPDGILFFDAGGKATLMVIATQESLAAQLEMAQDQDAPPELLTTLQELKLVPFFSESGGMYRKFIGQDWLQYCLPPQICRGQQTYYWALFNLPSHYLQGSVHSYQDFFRDQVA